MQIEIKTDLKAWSKSMSDIQKKQLPFAIATALTATAGRAGLDWQDEMRKRLDRPTPFTVNSVAVKPARKSNLVATVLVKDIASNYLEPFVDGGPHFLGGKRGLLTPKNVPLNAYGNLSKGKLAALKARQGVFIGPVTFKNGQTINGVWQRGQVGTRRGRLLRAGKYGTKGANNLKSNAAKGLTALTTLKLLIRFNDPQPVKQRLDFQGRAEAAVRKHFEAEFAKAFTHALATAK